MFFNQTLYSLFFQRWLATDEDDGKTIRELPVGEHGTLLKSKQPLIFKHFIPILLEIRIHVQLQIPVHKSFVIFQWESHT